MTRGLEPTEEYDGSIVVRLFFERAANERISCRSFEEAIEVVRDERHDAEVVEILDRDGELVFDSVDMDIDDWAAAWRHAKRRLSVDVEPYDCPYDDVACFADDHCVRCQMDAITNGE